MLREGSSQGKPNMSISSTYGAPSSSNSNCSRWAASRCLSRYTSSRKLFLHIGHAALCAPKAFFPSFFGPTREPRRDICHGGRCFCSTSVSTNSMCADHGHSGSPDPASCCCEATNGLPGYEVVWLVSERFCRPAARRVFGARGGGREDHPARKPRVPFTDF